MALPLRPAIAIEDDEPENETELIARHIKPHPGHCSRAYACLRDYGTSVSAIIRSLQLTNGNVSETATSWEIPEDAVRAAIGFYRRHWEFIDARILLEDDYWYGHDA